MLAGFGRQFGLETDTCLRLGRAFGAGLGQGGVCGALNGAFMILGLALKTDGEDEVWARYRSYDLVEHLIKEFIARHGSIRCRDLLGGVDPATAAGRAQALKEQLYVKLCPGFVDTAAELLDKVLADPPPSGAGSRVNELNEFRLKQAQAEET